MSVSRVGIGGVGVEADDGALGVGPVGELGAKTGAWLVLVTVQVKVSVSVQRAVGDGDDDVVGCRRWSRLEGAGDDAGGRVDGDAVGQVGGAVGERVAGRHRSRRHRG